MPKKDDEESNYFNHFGLAKDKKKKEKDFRMTLPPRPPGEPKSQSKLDPKKKIQQQNTNSKNIDESKNGSQSKSSDSLKNNENKDPNSGTNNGSAAGGKDGSSAAGTNGKNPPVTASAADIKDKDDKFVSWVTNGKQDDIHMCENVLFN